ncbi:hypothetical protein MLGJGCBP_04373 [Rhodococcus sp. T7]|nr:hypothetical protein MLGJGCBP_04373 [Rhodococcus sp. T7]
MRERLPVDVANVTEVLREGRVRFGAGPEHDEVLPPVHCGRRSDRDLRGAGEPAQQHCRGRVQHAERGGVVFFGQRPHSAVSLGPDRDVDAVGVPGLRGRPGPIGRQVQHLGHPRQPIGPVREVVRLAASPLTFAGGHLVNGREPGLRIRRDELFQQFDEVPVVPSQRRILVPIRVGPEVDEDLRRRPTRVHVDQEVFHRARRDDVVLADQGAEHHVLVEQHDVDHGSVQFRDTARADVAADVLDTAPLMTQRAHQLSPDLRH